MSSTHHKSSDISKDKRAKKKKKKKQSLVRTMTLGHKGALASTSNAKVIFLLRTAYVSFDYNG